MKLHLVRVLHLSRPREHLSTSEKNSDKNNVHSHIPTDWTHLQWYSINPQTSRAIVASHHSDYLVCCLKCHWMASLMLCGSRIESDPCHRRSLEKRTKEKRIEPTLDADDILVTTDNSFWFYLIITLIEYCLWWGASFALCGFISGLYWNYV